MTTPAIGDRYGFPDDGIGFSDVAEIFADQHQTHVTTNAPQGEHVSARDYFAGLAALARQQDDYDTRLAQAEAERAERERRDAEDAQRVANGVAKLHGRYSEIAPDRLLEHLSVMQAYDRMLTEPTALRGSLGEPARGTGEAAARFAAVSTTGEPGEPLLVRNHYSRNAQLAARYLLISTGHPDSYIGPYRAPLGILSLSDETLMRMPKNDPAGITQKDLMRRRYYETLPVIPRTAHPVAAILAADVLHNPQALPLSRDEWVHVVRSAAFAARERYGYEVPRELLRKDIDPHWVTVPSELRVLAELVAAEAHDLPNASSEVYRLLARRVHNAALSAQVGASSLPEKARNTFNQLIEYHREHRFDDAREYFRQLAAAVRDFVTDPVGWLGLPGKSSVKDS